MKFTWDPNKAAINEQKQGVTFREAATVFQDPYFVVFTDDAHSYGEQRYWIIGESNQRRVLLVVYTERGDLIRLISARPAGKREERVYEEEKYR
jgi:uncharacterized protein